MSAADATLPRIRHAKPDCPLASERPRPHRRVFRTLLGVGGVTAAATAATCALATHLLLNVTPSMPLGLYWMHFAARAPQRGELVALRVPAPVRALVRDRHYLPDRAFLLKPVGAVGGDTVCIEGDELRVDGAPWGRLRSTDSNGLPLPRDERCAPLPVGSVYVVSPDPRGFDSRVFGPVPINSLHATVTPLWTL